MDDSMKACREKWWSEIDLKEKTARLRQRVKELERDVGSLRKQVGELMMHSHGDSGLVIPIGSDYSMVERAYGSGGKRNDDTYF